MGLHVLSLSTVTEKSRESACTDAREEESEEIALLMLMAVTAIVLSTIPKVLHAHVHCLHVSPTPNSFPDPICEEGLGTRLPSQVTTVCGCRNVSVLHVVWCTCTDRLTACLSRGIGHTCRIQNG